jgi:hypothetical protein
MASDPRREVLKSIWMVQQSNMHTYDTAPLAVTAQTEHGFVVVIESYSARRATQCDNAGEVRESLMQNRLIDLRSKR